MTIQLTIYKYYLQLTIYKNDYTIDYIHGQMTIQLNMHTQMTIQLTIYIVK